MNKAISSKERDLLIGLLGVLIAVCVWFFYASPTMDKTDALQNENVALKEKAELYQAAASRVNEYSEGIVTNEIRIAEITDHYPGEIQTEDQLMYWANIGNLYPTELFFGDINIEERDAVALTGVEDLNGVEPTYNEDGSATVNDSEVPDITSAYVLYGAPMEMEVTCTYHGMKDMFNYIIGQYNRNSIYGFDISYDEANGVLVGTVGVEMYYIEGLDKEYVPTFIPAVPKGQADVFHTGVGSIIDIFNAVTGLVPPTELQTQNQDDDEA